MSSKQTVTFTLTEAQAKKWKLILTSKEPVKKLTTELRELEKLRKYQKTQQLKKTNKKQRELSLQGFTTDSYGFASWKQYSPQISTICDISCNIYDKFIFSGKEHHFQSALEEELRDAGYQVQQEIARLLHYKKKNGETIQLSHDIRGREDLLLPRQKLILELKQVAKLTDKDFYQLARYMQERCDNSPWSTDTRGLLINFGDTQLECWYLFYDKTTNRLQRVWSKVKNKVTFESLIDTSYCNVESPARL